MRGGGFVALGAALAMAVLSCGRERSTTPADPVTPADPTKPGRTAATGPATGGAELPPFTYAPGKPGPAYFAVRHEGVVMLDDGELTKIEGSPTELVTKIAQGLDGRMYLRVPEGVMRLEGAEIRFVAEAPERSMISDFAVDRDGTIWGVGWKGVVSWDGSSWKTEDATGLGSDVPQAVTIDGRARVWVTSSHALHVREDGKWHGVDVSAQWTSPPAFVDVGTGPGGVALAVAADGILELSTSKELRRVQVDGERDLLLETLGCSPAGVIGLQYNLDEVVRIGLDGTKARWRAKQDFAASDINEVTPDDAGRIWIATDVGVVILGPGDEKVDWRSGRVAQLAGLVSAIGVAGAGPVLPSNVGPVEKGGLQGKLVKDGKPLARTAVELCPAPRLASETTPCDESATRIATTTDAGGRFAVKDVPLGLYGLAAKVGPKWHVVFRAEYRVRERGKDHDVGEIEIEVKPAKP